MMLRLVLPLAALLAAAPVAAVQDASAYGYPQQVYDTDGQSVDSVAVFYEPLSRYGRWLDTRFGRAWSPNVGRDWRPYTIGHWEEGPYGQTWRSDEPFGWAVFHFGRWGFDPAIGWVWTPDTVWGPGWVAWRDGDDIAGWAPLPPRVSLSFSFGAGYNDGFNGLGYDQWYQPGWVYVPRDYLYGRSLRGAFLPYGHNRDYWAGTRGITRYDRVDGRVINRSFERNEGRHDNDRRDGGRRDGFGGGNSQHDEFRGDDARRDQFRRDAGRSGDPRRDDPRRDNSRRDGFNRNDGRRVIMQDEQQQRLDDARRNAGVVAVPAIDPRGYSSRQHDFGQPLNGAASGFDPRRAPRRVDDVPRFSGGVRAAPPAFVPPPVFVAPTGSAAAIGRPAPVVIRPMQAAPPPPQRVEPRPQSQGQPRERNENIRPQ